MNIVSSGKLWGMFAEGYMAYDMDRSENAITQPSLAEMTAKAIELLSQNDSGFFLMVEGSKIDWAAHANDPIGLISEILAFDDAVKIALDYARTANNTMILIMADHATGGLAIGSSFMGSAHSSGSVQKYLEPLKKARLTGEGIVAKMDAGRNNVAEVMKNWYGISDLSDAELVAIKRTSNSEMNDRVGPMISRRAGIGWTTTGHTGEEVALFSYLPNNGRITGTLENTDIAAICADVLGIDLATLTAELYNDAQTYFDSAGAEVTTDLSVPADGRMTVKKGDTSLLILENKNYVMLDGTKVAFDSVVVSQNGRFYVPRSVLAMIPSQGIF
jgi:alkaline phosphatase